MLLPHTTEHSCSQTIVSVQSIRRELAEKRFTAELNVDASWKFLNDVGCDATQINMDSEDGKLTSSVFFMISSSSRHHLKNFLCCSKSYWNTVVALPTTASVKRLSAREIFAYRSRHIRASIAAFRNRSSPYVCCFFVLITYPGIVLYSHYPSSRNVFISLSTL